MRIRFRLAKDVAMLPLHGFLTLTRWLPEGLIRLLLSGIGALGKLVYFVPGNHMRRTSRNMAHVCGRDDPRRMYFDLVDNFVRLLNAYSQLVRYGGERVARSFRLDEHARRVAADVKARYGHGIIVVPHCVGSVLGAAGFGRTFPSIVLLRESRNRLRSDIMKQYFERLGPRILYARRTDASTLTRGILKALREKKFVVGTTDLIRRTEDSVPVRVFGEEVWVAGWPVRFSARRGTPIVPGYVRIDDEGILLQLGEPFVAEADPAAASQRWAAYFEENFKKHPSDWIFQFDKRWAAVLAAAAGAGHREEDAAGDGLGVGNGR